MTQLILDLALPEPEPFTDFIPGENAELLFQLHEWTRQAMQARFVYLWGDSGAGKSHLLAAAARRSHALLIDAGNKPLPEDIEPDCMLAVDNVDRLDRRGQELLFAHFNTLRSGNGSLLASGSLPPMLLAILPDLATRLAWGLVYQLKPLSDADKTRALQTRSRQLGFELGSEQADYLLRHAPRDIASLYRILEEADNIALSRHKPITLSLLREALGQQRSIF